MNVYNSFLFVAFSAIFTIVNPLGALGPFIAMTAGDSAGKRKSTAARACWMGLGILCGTAAVGTLIFRLLGITLPALKIAGGILLFLVAVDMINARPSGAKGSEEETKEGAMKEDIAIFPLGIPLLSGPGSIVTIIILVDRAKGVVEHAMIYLSAAITMLLTFLVLRQATRVAYLLGQSGINVFSRLMGIALAAIAIQFILDGLGSALPGLNH